MMEVSQAAADIIPRIKELEKLSGEDLENEMKLLKTALLENPDAVQLMYPEDVGLLVSALRRVTGQSISEAMTEKKAGTKKTKAKALTADEMAAAFDEL
jgi:hypothetical protein